MTNGYECGCAATALCAEPATGRLLQGMRSRSSPLEQIVVPFQHDRVFTFSQNYVLRGRLHAVFSNLMAEVGAATVNAQESGGIGNEER
jgi:hypothetical protein